MTALPTNYDPADLEAVSKVLTREQILSQNIEWSKLKGAGIISEEELRLTELYDNQPEERKIGEFKSKPNAFASLFLNIIGGSSGVASLDRTRYGLSLIEEILEIENTSYAHFLEIEDTWSPFLRIMQTKGDSYCCTKAAKTISLLLFRSKQVPESVLEEVMQWCNDQLREPQQADMALEGLQNLLRSDDIRVKFYEDDGLNRLGNLIKDPTADTQTIYKTLFCLWLLSYNHGVANKFYTTNVIHHIVNVLRNLGKEKITRIGMAVLTNILNKGEENGNNQQMIEAKIARVLDNLNQKKWADIDLVADLELLTQTITDNIGEMSSWEAYKTEVSSGILEKTPVHNSERFWKENILMFEKNNFEVLGMLIMILRESQNTQNLEIACRDIGEFIRFHPMGRQIIKQLDGKYIIMGLMEHPDASVQKEALLCSQKLLVVSWEHLGSR